MRVRTLACSLVLSALLLGLFPSTLHAEDDTETGRLERRVEMLMDIVAQLRAQVRELGARVELLEALLEEAPPPAPVRPTETIPAIPIVPAPIVVWPDVSGTYRLDREATIQAVYELQSMDAGTADAAAELLEEITLEFSSIDISLTLTTAGGFRVAFDDGTAHTARGTWRRDESYVGRTQRLTLVTTHEDGELESDPETLVGTWENGRLRLDQPETSEYALVFVRGASSD